MNDNHIITFGDKLGRWQYLGIQEDQDHQPQFHIYQGLDENKTSIAVSVQYTGLALLKTLKQKIQQNNALR